MPPTVSILDDFNRSDETPLDGGGNWVSMAGFWPNALRLTSNQVARAAGGDSGRQWNTSYAIPFESYITIATRPNNTGGNLRVEAYESLISVDSTPDGYYVEFIATNFGVTHHVKLWRRDNGTATQLGSSVDANSIADGDALWIEITATHAKLHTRRGGTWQEDISVADTTHTGPFFPSLGIDTDTSGGVIRLDDFAAGVTGAAPSGRASLIGGKLVGNGILRAGLVN